VLGIGPEAVLRTDKCERLAAAFASSPSREGASAGLDALLGRPTWAGATQQLLESFLAEEKAVELSVDAALRAAEGQGLLGDEPVVVVATDTNPRHLGKCATALSERTGRPAAVAVSHRDQHVGELRAPFGVNLVEILGEHRALLASWGGHRTAAGFSASLEHATELLERLRDAFARCARKQTSPRIVEGDIVRTDIDVAFSRSLRAALPFGRGNASPLFRLRDYRAAVPAPASEGGEESVDLIERDFPEVAEERTPLVTFLPKGRGGLIVRFEGWDTEESR
jgi:hypothetical protein